MSNRKAESQKSRARKTRAPDEGTPPKPKKMSRLRLMGLLAIAGLVVSALATLFLLEGPDVQGQQSGQGGESTVSKDGETQIAVPEQTKAPAPSSPLPQAVVETPKPQAAVETTVPVPALPSTPDAPALTRGLGAAPAPAEPAVISQATVPLPGNPESPTDARQQTASPPIPDPRPQPDAGTAPAQALPWQGQPKPNAKKPPVVANLPPQATTENVRLPSRSDVRGWAKSTAREFVGGVDADGLPLYRFDIWIDAPKDVLTQIQQVSYEYLAPSAQPAAQKSNDVQNGFRVKFGAAACAEKARITLTMIDGNERKVDVDGCRILN